MNADKTALLDTINNPEDLRKLDVQDLPRLCSEIRTYLVDTVSQTSGHLASGLAVVDLTVALHYVFDTPKDEIVWDVGHQAYPHKILTGHKKELKTIRQKDGLHAFIWRGETPYDLLSTGHASTSIGSALGLAMAAKLKGEKKQVVAVIGDGALSGGAAFEALNCAGSTKDLNMLVILNDNEMSISKNVGSIAQSLSRLIANPHYAKLIKGGRKILESLPAIHDFAMRAQEHVKGMVMPGTLFEELGFNYIGPVDGNDVQGLVSILKNIEKLDGLQFLHIVTTKGKGYVPAEEDPISYHGVPVFDPEHGIEVSPKPATSSYSASFGKWLCQKAKKEEKLVAITPAMRVGSGMSDFAKDFPDRFFDVGIAEQHSMVFASGLAAGGLRPIVNIYSSFLQRAYDGVIHDFAIQDLPIVLAIDRGGVVGPDGPTHQGVYDISFLRTVPNIVMMTPSSYDELFRMMDTAYALGHPAVVRFARDKAVLDRDPYKEGQLLEIGKGRIINRGKNIALCVFGPMVYDYLKVCEELDITLCDMRFVKPLDKELIKDVCATHKHIITVEDGALLGGIGEAIATFICENKFDVSVKSLGIPDRFLMEDTRKHILHDLKLDAEGIYNLCKSML